LNSDIKQDYVGRSNSKMNKNELNIIINENNF